VAPGLLAVPGKQLLCQMAVDDFQVPNLATEVYARTLGIPLLSDTALPIRGLEVKSGPLPSALSTWDLHEEAPPPGNVAPPYDMMNDVHNQLRTLPDVMTQIDEFQRGGQVVSTCKGTCSESADAGIPLDIGTDAGADAGPDAGP
jgi:hypothetical protein